MTSELKRTMKLMWGHSRKMRSACGCSLFFLGLFCALAYVGEWLFVGRLNLKIRPDRVLDGYDYGIASCMMFLLASLNGNTKMVLSNIGKWLLGSKLGKSVMVRGLIVNRLIIFGAMFLPCLISRIVLVCLGHTEFARLGLFFVTWGAVYLLSCVGCTSTAVFISIFVLYFTSMAWDKFWVFATWIEVSVPIAVFLFAACLVIGTVIEKKVLEAAYRKRVCRPQLLLQTEVNGR